MLLYLLSSLCGIIGISYIFRDNLTILGLDLYTKLRYFSSDNNKNNVKIIAIDNTNNQLLSKYASINTIIIETSINGFIIIPNINKPSNVLSISIVIDNQEIDITKALSKYFIDNINISKQQFIGILEYNKINYENITTIDIIDNNADNYIIDFIKDFILVNNSNKPLIGINYL